MKKIFSILIAMVMIFSIPIDSMAVTSHSKCNLEYRIPDNLESLAYNESRYAKYKSVIVVNTNSLDSDGLSASGLVGAANGAICCLSDENSLQYLDTLLNGDTSKTIYFIGGEKVMPSSIKQKYLSEGYKCITLAGENRIKTSYKVAQEIKKIKGSIKEIAITKGYGGEIDAASIAYESRAKGMPIILTNGNSIPFSTKGIKTYAIGGNKVISYGLAKKTNAIRLAGENRYLTNKKILEYFHRTKGNFSLCVSTSSVPNTKTAILLGCAPSAAPVFITSENSDKSVLTGARRIRCYTNISESLYFTCFHASYGKEILDAYETVWAKSGLKKSHGQFVYNNTNTSTASYSKNFNSYKRDYYLFEYFTLGGDHAPICVMLRKKDKKLYYWSAWSGKLSLYPKYATWD